MRISTNYLHQLGVDAMLDQQARLSKTQQQLATGKRIFTAAEDPVGAAAVMSLTQLRDTNNQYQVNAEVGSARLNTAEGVLINVSNILQRMRELAVQANNASQTNQTRAFLAVEVREYLDELMGLANTMTRSNEYLFSGSKVSTKPFARDAAGNFSYNGDQGRRYTAVGQDYKVATSDPGSEVFMAIRNGNGTFVTSAGTANTGTGVIDDGSVVGNFQKDTYVLSFIQALPTDPVTYQVVDNGGAGAVVASGTYSEGDEIAFNGAVITVKGTPADGDTFTISPSANQDIFSTLHDFATALETASGRPEEFALMHNSLGRAIADIDQALEHMSDSRAKIGARLRSITEQVDFNDAYNFHISETLSDLRDLDYAEAIGRLNLEMIGLQAAQQSYARVQGLSLFNYL